MLVQSQVDRWLADVCNRLKQQFGDRLIYVGHIGSWARAEPCEESDIDCLVVLDIVGAKDIYTVRGIFQDFSRDGFKPGGILVSVRELKHTPPFHMSQLFSHGCRVLYGSIDGLIAQPSTSDYLIDIKMKACDNLHTARHLLMFSRDLSKAVTGLKSNFYSCFFALQNWVLVTKGKYVERKKDIVKYLDDTVDLEVVRVARDWYEINQDLTSRALHYVELLECWSRGMLIKLESLKQ